VIPRSRANLNALERSIAHIMHYTNVLFTYFTVHESKQVWRTKHFEVAYAENYDKLDQAF